MLKPKIKLEKFTSLKKRENSIVKQLNNIHCSDVTFIYKPDSKGLTYITVIFDHEPYKSYISKEITEWLTKGNDKTSSKMLLFVRQF